VLDEVSKDAKFLLPGTENVMIDGLLIESRVVCIDKEDPRRWSRLDVHQMREESK
jgi:hypothetical protein